MTTKIICAKTVLKEYQNDKLKRNMAAVSKKKNVAPTPCLKLDLKAFRYLLVIYPFSFRLSLMVTLYNAASAGPMVKIGTHVIRNKIFNPIK